MHSVCVAENMDMDTVLSGVGINLGWVAFEHSSLVFSSVHSLGQNIGTYHSVPNVIHLLSYEFRNLIQFNIM